jgi:hypothetical protein
MGVDHGLVTHLARWLLSEVDVIPKALLVATREQLEGVGNTSAIPVPALKDTCEFLEEEFQDIYNVHDIKFPMDVEGAEYVFFPAVSDYLLEPDTLMGNAAVMHLTGGSWTIGTGNYDGINYGLFYSDRMMERIVKNVVAEVRRLKGKKILVGECGHATRSAWFAPTFCGPDAPEVVNFMQYTHAQLTAGKIPLKKELIKERITYHDPCNIARAGRITEEPREILNTICEDFVEMTPNRTENYCCGGGAGTVVPSSRWPAGAGGARHWDGACSPDRRSGMGGGCGGALCVRRSGPPDRRSRCPATRHAADGRPDCRPVIDR